MGARCCCCEVSSGEMGTRAVEVSSVREAITETRCLASGALLPVGIFRSSDVLVAETPVLVPERWPFVPVPRFHGEVGWEQEVSFP